MEKLIHQEISDLIKQGLFQEATQKINSYSQEQITNDGLDNVAYWMTQEKANVCAYGFMCYWAHLQNNKNAFIKAGMTLEIGTPYVIGAYSVAYAYAKRAIELNPEDKDLSLYLLSMYRVPESEISTVEQREIATYVLEKWPEDKYAQAALSYTKEFADSNEQPTKNHVAMLIKEDKACALKWLIRRGMFIETRSIINEFSEGKIVSILKTLATEERNVTAYDYLWFLAQEQGETAKNHLIAAELCWLVFESNVHPYDPLEGAKELHDFHIRRAAELESKSSQ